mmetsp:Transcript_30760/g.69019  ORF Transcript_30760/g.69019 Transcript_30760/m.69019 type:complete len:225 (-) Transcript_30760:1028-1702(-)
MRPGRPLHRVAAPLFAQDILLGSAPEVARPRGKHAQPNKANRLHEGEEGYEAVEDECDRIAAAHVRHGEVVVVVRHPLVPPVVVVPVIVRLGRVGKVVRVALGRSDRFVAVPLELRGDGGVAEERGGDGESGLAYRHAGQHPAAPGRLAVVHPQRREALRQASGSAEDGKDHAGLGGPDGAAELLDGLVHGRLALPLGRLVRVLHLVPSRQEAGGCSILILIFK